MTTRILIGDCRDVLKTLPDQSVHCCVTSPPYWGLRAYLPSDHPDKAREIGSEPTLQEWVDTMVAVFREVRRVLRDDGTLWLNLGDSYSAGTNQARRTTQTGKHGYWENEAVTVRRNVETLKPKDLMGQPWRVAFALQADGWWLRQEIIWNKPNPMPESIRDRFTKAHEHVFLLSKSPRYWFDFDAVQEPTSGGAHARLPGNVKAPKGQAEFEATGYQHHRTKANNGVGFGHGTDRDERGRTRQTYEGVGRREGPPGNPAEGKVVTNGTWERPRKGVPNDRKLAEAGSGTKNNVSFDEAMAVMPATRNPRDVFTIPEDEWAQFQQWKASQPIAPDVWTVTSEPFKGAHFATFPTELIRPAVLAGCPEGGTVLDPFGGSGTTGLVADQHGRNAILIDLDERNKPMAERRIVGDAGLFAEVTP